MKSRFIIFMILLIAVVGATVWRAMNPRQRDSSGLILKDVRPAPLFQLLDQKSKPVQLSGYLHRHRNLLHFFDATKGPEADPVMLKLREVHSRLKRLGIMVFAISSPLSPEFKPAAANFPFPVLRDTLAGQPGSCCALWGRARAAADNPAAVHVDPATFLIEADGLVAWDGEAPKPLDDALALLTELVRD